MMKPKLGILHPGRMGVSVAATAKRSGCAVFWVSAGRSIQTCERAAKLDLGDAGSLVRLTETCEVIVSVCPPHAAEEVATQVAEYGFTGLYLDANAISPQRAIRIGEIITEGTGQFVDGGIVGGPAWEPGRTWLYLSGPLAEKAVSYFSDGPLETAVIGKVVGKASALKMCYAAYTKGTTALLCAILAAAEEYGVREALNQQWARDWGDFPKQTERRARKVTAKAWRFAGEMEEIAETFDAAGLPVGFHQAAKEIFLKLGYFKGAPKPPTLREVFEALGGFTHE